MRPTAVVGPAIKNAADVATATVGAVGSGVLAIHELGRRSGVSAQQPTAAAGRKQPAKSRSAEKTIRKVASKR